MATNVFLPILGLAVGFLFALAADRAVADDTGRVVITAQDIAEMKVNRIADVFNQVPGVAAGTSSVSIHGSYKVKVFLDGTPLNDPASGHGGINWGLVPIESIERIEILRDSGSMRYGQDASGGVILITSKGVDTWSGNVKAYGGNEDTGHLDFNLGTRKGLWDLGFKGAYDTSQSYGTNNDRERWQTGLKASYNPSETRFLSLSAYYLGDERGMSGLPDFPTPDYRQRKRNLPVGLTGRYDDFGNTAYYSNGQVDNTDSSTGLDTSLKVTELGDDATYDFNTGKTGVLTLGAGFHYGQAASTEFEDQEEHSYYLLADEKYKLGAWTLKAGARSNYNSAFENALNPEASLTYAAKRWDSTSSYSRSSNTPSFQQRYNHTSSTRPNPNLGMETSDNFSQAFNFQPVDDISLGLTFYYNRLSDRITYVRPVDSGIAQYQNIGLATYKGGDLVINWRANKVLTFKTSYTYLEAIDEDLDKWITAKARHVGNFEVYIKPFTGFSNVLKASYSSPVYTDQNNTKQLASYLLFGFRSEYSFGKWSVFLQVDNLLDKTYLYSDGLLAPPMTWILGFNRNL